MDCKMPSHNEIFSAEDDRSRFLLPPIAEGKEKTIVLDMDNTLTFTDCSPPSLYDFVLNIPIEDKQDEYIVVYVQERPLVHQLLHELSKNNYEIVIFTASCKSYADQVIDGLDINNVISYRLYRDSCTVKEDNTFVKDLSALGRDLKNVFIVDDSPINYSLQPENGIPVVSFFGNVKDRELQKVIDFCNTAKEFPDVRDAIAKEFRGVKYDICDYNFDRWMEIDIFGRSSRGEISNMDDVRKKTIVLDVNLTLVFTSMEPLTYFDFIVSMPDNSGVYCIPLYVKKRPGVEGFLCELAKDYEIVAFSGGRDTYMNLILDKLDVNFVIKKRFHSRALKQVGDEWVKDLSIVNRDLRDVVIVDDDPGAYSFQPENAVAVTPFNGSRTDTALHDILGLLKKVAGYEDVRIGIRNLLNPEGKGQN